MLAGMQLNVFTQLKGAPKTATGAAPAQWKVTFQRMTQLADCSGMQTVRAPLPDSFDALEESVFLMHVAANPGVVQ